jgi:hypothetical protein
MFVDLYVQRLIGYLRVGLRLVISIVDYFFFSGLV